MMIVGMDLYKDYFHELIFADYPDFYMKVIELDIRRTYFKKC